MSFEFTRNIGDATFQKTTAAPMPGHFSFCDSYVNNDEAWTYLPIDIGDLLSGTSRPEIEAEITFTYAPLLGDGKKITASLLHSDYYGGLYEETIPAVTAHVIGITDVTGPGFRSACSSVQTAARRKAILGLAARCGC